MRTAVCARVSTRTSGRWGSNSTQPLSSSGACSTPGPANAAIRGCSLVGPVACTARGCRIPSAHHRGGTAFLRRERINLMTRIPRRSLLKSALAGVAWSGAASAQDEKPASPGHRRHPFCLSPHGRDDQPGDRTLPEGRGRPGADPLRARERPWRIDSRRDARALGPRAQRIDRREGERPRLPAHALLLRRRHPHVSRHRVVHRRGTSDGSQADRLHAPEAGLPPHGARRWHEPRGHRRHGRGARAVR